METEFDDVCYIITPSGNAFQVTVGKGGDKITFLCNNMNGDRGHTTISLYAMCGAKFAGYKFIRSEQEFLAWMLKHG